jgi:uncharacterized protein YkwD
MGYSFCPDCGGRLPVVTGQVLPDVPAAGLRRKIPGITFAAALFLVLIVVAVLVPSFILPVLPAPAAVNASTLQSSSAASGVTGTTANDTLPAPSLPEPYIPGNKTGSGEMASTTPITPGPSRAPTFAGPVITIIGTRPYAYHAPAMGSSAGVPVINATSLESRVHERVNQVRQEHGLPALGKDMMLVSIARAHSSDMAAHGYFGHVNLQEKDPTARGAAAGYTCYKDDDAYYSYTIAENLFAMYRYDSVLFAGSRAIEYDWNTEEAIAEETVDAWMKSPDHRDNLLATDVKQEGIGVAVSKDDLVFVTEDLC